MRKSAKYSSEVIERAVRMVFEHGAEHGAEHASQWSAIESIAAKIGCTAETLGRWVRHRERDGGQREGLTECERITALEPEARFIHGCSLPHEKQAWACCHSDGS